MAQLASITFPNDPGEGLLSVLYLLKKALDGGPVFKFRIGPNASINGMYVGDMTYDDYYTLQIQLEGSNEVVEIRLDSITEIEYL